MPEPFNACTYLIDRHVAEGRGERVAVTGPAGTLSYAGLLALVENLAAGLRELGVRPEERVVMAASDSPAPARRDPRGHAHRRGRCPCQHHADRA